MENTFLKFGSISYVVYDFTDFGSPVIKSKHSKHGSLPKAVFQTNQFENITINVKLMNL